MQQDPQAPVAALATKAESFNDDVPASRPGRMSYLALAVIVCAALAIFYKNDIAAFFG